MKRTLDFSVALLLLVLGSPILMGITIIILCQRDGAVLFRQKRIGHDRQPFTIFKFRSMRERDPDTIDQVNEKVIATGVDTRITPFGRFLRSTSLDELPQLFNILNGTMSLVGPRPVIPEQLLAIPEDQMGRFEAKPGVTGWSQVNGRRGLSWPDQLKLDSWYAANRTFWLDIKILVKTPFVILCASGVYNDAANNWRAFLPSATDEHSKTRP